MKPSIYGSVALSLCPCRWSATLLIKLILIVNPVVVDGQCKGLGRWGISTCIAAL